MSSIATQNVKPTPLSHAAGLNITGLHGLPESFPSAVPNAWVGQDLAGKESSWIYRLNSAECIEIAEGLSNFKGTLLMSVGC